MNRKRTLYCGFILVIVVFILIIIALRYCFYIFKNCPIEDEQITSLGLSSDGHYVISVDNKGLVVLWDLEKKSKKLLDQKGNIYSAFFIKNTDKFMWQNYETNDIYIKNTDNSLIKNFNVPGLVNSHGIGSDLHYYVTILPKTHTLGCNYFFIDFSKNYQVNKLGINEFLCGGTPHRFDFAFNDKVLISYVHGSILMKINDSNTWFDHIADLLMEYRENIGNTFATLSPDGNFVVGGDENMRVYVWETMTGKQLFHLYDLRLGKKIITTADDPEHLYHGKLDTDYIKYDESTLKARMPNDYDHGFIVGVFSIKFVDQTHYLLFGSPTHYAILYDLLDPSPLKYFDIGYKPVHEDYSRDLAIDSSPSAHILVMAKQDEGGILVYKWDPEKWTLEKIWEGF